MYVCVCVCVCVCKVVKGGPTPVSQVAQKVCIGPEGGGGGGEGRRRGVVHDIEKESCSSAVQPKVPIELLVMC